MDPLTVITGVISVGKTLIAARKWDRERLDKRLAEVVQQNDHEVIQLLYTVARSIVAHALGASFTDGRVDEFLAAGVNDPRFPARAHRLLGEARKSASRERRKMLVAALHVVPLTGVPINNQDRLDMLFERLLPDEVDLLQRIAAFHGVPPREPENNLFIATYAGAWARFIGDELQIGPGDSLSDRVVGPNEPNAEPFIANQLAFSALGTLALIELRDSTQDFAISPHAYFAELQQLTITPLGGLVLHALRDEHMRAGMSADALSARGR